MELLLGFSVIVLVLAIFASVLTKKYKTRLARLKKEGKDEKDPLYQQTLLNAQELIRRANAGQP